MTRKLQPLDLSKDHGTDRIVERPTPEGLRWSLVLTWFMRLLAVLWLAKGLLAWATIVGATPGLTFEGRSTGYQATLMYFAVIDLVAAVGLWMASTWGGVLWLLAVMSHMILAVFFPRIIEVDVVTMSLFSGLIVAYLVVSWLSARQQQ